MTAAEASKALNACLVAAEQCAKVTDSSTRLMPSTVGELAVAAKTFAEAAATLDRLTRLPATGGVIPGHGVTGGSFLRSLGDRNRDAAVQAVQSAVRLRDGDNCRFCGKTVEWVGRTTHRTAELFLLSEAVVRREVTADRVVVACKGCAFAQETTTGEASTLPLLQPPPVAPWYSPRTATLLRTHGHDVSAGRHIRDDTDEDASPPY